MKPVSRRPFPVDEEVHQDCRFFKGDRPCLPHKQEGVHCDGCPHYDRITQRVLIIKLGAVGDVIRTTPILRALRSLGVHISWLTETPEILPKDWVDRVIKPGVAGTSHLLATHYDALYNLDKDDQAIALCKLVAADKKFGFTVEEGVCAPIEERARHKWLTGVFDDLNRMNYMSYPEEIFQICGLEFKGEEYVLELDDSPPFSLNLSRPLIGLNTGCGLRWPSRIWAKDNWIGLTEMLRSRGLGVLLLGGPDEDERNREIAAASGADYLGHFPLKRFLHLVNETDLLVTGVTMALHVGIGLDKRIVLLNSIFNRNEFELYGLGRIVEPDVDCLGCFKAICDRDCMNLLKPAEVFEAIMGEIALLKAGARRRGGNIQNTETS